MRNYIPFFLLTIILTICCAPPDPCKDLTGGTCNPGSVLVVSDAGLGGSGGSGGSGGGEQLSPSLSNGPEDLLYTPCDANCQ